MNRRRNVCLILLIAVCLAATSTAIGQEGSQEFALTNARQGEPYRIEIESVLRDKYRLRLESERNAIILWSMVSGELPAGLTVQSNGTINGVVTEPQAGVYRFRLKAVDVNARNEALELQFSIELQARRLRLSRIDGPRLVPVSMNSEDNGISSSNYARVTPPAASSEVKNEPEPPSAVAAPAPEIEIKRAADDEDFKNPFSSLNKRFIIGFEQSGGASADSKGQPFMDLFINTPLTSRDEGKPARVSIWGDVRLTSTPSQIDAFSNLASDAIGTLTGGETNEFVSGFDFVVGPEIRLSRFKNTDLSFIAGFGAISPLNPRKSVQIFEIPKVGTSQRQPFLELFPDAEDKEFIAFVSPDRDRFLRQYFGGIRLKTYSYDKVDKDGKRTLASETIQNVFPAMLDITFGQSEAITGGKLTKFVLSIDGFYPLPFPDKYRFLYLFGTAKFKVGGPKSITKPLILDTAASSVKITDTTVFIADPIISNRDFYRIGFGVDLLELFRKKKN
jgi:hypothetical protein